MKIPDRGRWERLSPLLDELLGLDEGAQQRRLAALRVEEATLADELQGMLIESQRAGALRFLEDGAPRVEAEQGLAGMQIGAYVLESLLGEGGGGTVWKATRADGRYEGVVAVKLLHLSLIGSAGAQRFAREGAILARLTHPNIARLLDAGVTTAGQPYLVLEFVDGIAIDRHCDTLRLSVEERLALFEDVLAGVAHAHNHLIIHRDIKPNNILVTADGMVKLLDFGIAKLLQDDGSATVDGQRALTPRYAAPEQLQNGPVTTATDVYSLGVLLYHLLVGRHPTAADTANPADILRATLDTDPAKMTSVLTRATETLDDDAQRLAADRATSVPRLRRQLEGDLETIVGVALRKDAAQRYQSVLAMSADVRRYLAHEPVSARPASWRYRCAKFVRRNRGSVAAGLLVALSVAAGVVGTVTQARRAEVLAFKAQHERDNALRQLSYAKATNEFVAFLLQEGSDKPFTTSDLLARAEPVLRMQFASDPSQRAHLLAEIASQYAQSTYLDKANELLVQARAAASESTDPALQGSIDCLFAFLKGIDGSFGLAEKTFEEALGKLHRDPDVDRALVGECLQFRAEVADIKGDRTAAYRYAREAVDTLAPLRAEDRSLSIVLHQTLANTQAALGQSAAGAAEYRKAVAELEAMGRGSTRGASVMYQNLGAILARAGQTFAAIDAVEHALEISRGLGGPLPSLQSNHASYLAEIGHTREAGAMIDAALVEARARGDKRSAPFIAVQGAHAWCMAGGLARCGELLAMGRMELASIVPSGHPAFAALETTQAELDIARGDDSHARETLLKAVAICDAAGEKGGVRVRALELLARTELRLGDTAAAQTHADGAVAQARSMAGGFEHSQLLGSSRLVQGLVAEALGRHDAARASWSEAAANLVATVGASAPQTLEAKRLLGS